MKQKNCKKNYSFSFFLTASTSIAKVLSCKNWIVDSSFEIGSPNQEWEEKTYKKDLKKRRRKKKSTGWSFFGSEKGTEKEKKEKKDQKRKRKEKKRKEQRK